MRISSALGWRRLAGPAAFLLAATLAILVFHPSLRSDGGKKPPTTSTISQKHPASAPKRTYVVRAGDTFETISKRTGVPVATIRALNPSVRPTELFIAEKIRLR